VIEKWLDEGWSPWRIAYGTASLVALGVTVVGYAAHPHHPGPVWWLLAAIAVVAAWALLEMVRWRTRHNRLQRRLAEYESKPSAATVTDPSPEPLQPHYEQSVPYRLPNEHMFHHRIGIRNSVGNPTATGVRLHWTGMSPRPAIDHGFPPVVPQAVPMLAGGDPAIGISLPAGQEELWVIATTATDSEGVITVGTFGPRRPGWHGTPWSFEVHDRWRLTYRIVTDNLPDAAFSIVMTAVDGHIRCDLEG
jgi:hypothetical protein